MQRGFDLGLRVNDAISYTVSGARVARLFEGDVEAGVMQTATFDNSVTTGIYVYVLRWNGEMITGKVIITR